MDFSSLLVWVFLALGGIIAYILLFKFIKSMVVLRMIVGFFSIALMVGTLFLFVGGFFALRDANEFREQFSNSTNLFVYEDGQTVVTAIIFEIGQSNDVKIVSEEQLRTIQTLHDQNRFDELRDGYYKVVFIDANALADYTSEELSDKHIDLTIGDIRSVLDSDDAKNTLADIIAKQSGAANADIRDSLQKDDAYIKGFLFSYVIEYFFNPLHFDSFVDELRDKTIEVHEETMLFKMLRFTPKALLNKAINNIQSTRSNSE